MGNFIFRVHVGYSKAVIDVSAVTKKAFLFASKLILCIINLKNISAFLQITGITLLHTVALKKQHT